METGPCLPRPLKKVSGFISATVIEGSRFLLGCLFTKRDLEARLALLKLQLENLEFVLWDCSFLKLTDSSSSCSRSFTDLSCIKGWLRYNTKI